MSAVMPVEGQMFGKQWWTMSLVARYASIDAHKCGLMVQIEEGPRPQHRDAGPCITWRGTAEQFQKTKTFPNGVCAKRLSGKYVHPDQLRGTVYPTGEDEFVFVIEFCNYYGKSYPRRIVKEALQDEAYLNFRDAIMAGYPLASLQSEPIGG